MDLKRVERIKKETYALLESMKEEFEGKECIVFEMALSYVKDGDFFLGKGKLEDAALAYDYAYGLLYALKLLKKEKCFDL